VIIKVLGSGCKKCQVLTNNTKVAIEEIGIDAEIIKVTDFKEIMGFGVMSTPALVIDEEVVSVGKVLKAKQIKELIHKAR
jgi:small redox-active disulfide protein 2